MRGARLLDGPVDVQPFEDLLPAHQAGVQARVTALTKRMRWFHIGCMRDRNSPVTTANPVILGLGEFCRLRELWARHPQVGRESTPLARRVPPDNPQALPLLSCRRRHVPSTRERIRERRHEMAAKKPANGGKGWTRGEVAQL
jgi:hypothetical protein